MFVVNESQFTDILAVFGIAASIPVRPLHGGFSGARVFALGDPPVYVLKAWPPAATVEHVRFAHRMQMLAAVSLAAVPKLIPARDGETFFHEHRIWELTSSRPGAPAQRLNEAQADAAGRMMAALHDAWDREIVPEQDDPIRRRARFVNELLNRCRSVNADDSPEIVRDARELLPPQVSIATRHPPHACLIHGDLHREHILFTGDAISGVLDFASVKSDHPAVDLGRYFGEYDGDALHCGVEAYRAAGGDPAVNAELVGQLTRILTVGAAATWVLRFAANDVPVERHAAATARLVTIVARLRGQTANGPSAAESVS